VSPVKKYTAFIFEGQVYVFNVVPFGLNISMPAFSRGMDFMIGSDSYDDTTNYVDDVLLNSKGSFQKHLGVLRNFFTKVRDSGMTIKLNKSKFFRKELPFLGHLLTTSGIKVTNEKIESVKNYPLPKTKRQLQGFLGLINYMRKFLPHLSTVEAPLLELIKSDEKSIQRKIREQKYLDAFEKIKLMLIDAKPLSHIDPNLPFYVEADASTVGIGGLIYQIDTNGEKRLIAFCSKILNAAQTRYTITELELFAIVYTLTRFRNILIGNEIIIMSDHKALTFLNTCFLVTGRLTRWKILLQEFYFIVKYIKGEENYIADYLSRLNAWCDTTSLKADSPKELQIFKLHLAKKNIPEWKNLAKLQREDEKLAKIINLINSEVPTALNIKDQQLKEMHCIYGEVLFRKRTNDEYWKICIPRILIERLVTQQHEFYGHFGPLKIFKVMSETFCFNNMRRKINRLIAKCVLCQKTKVLNRNYMGEMQPVLASRPGELVAVDLYGELPQGRGRVKFIFVIYDIFSKYVKLYPVNKPTANKLLTKIDDYCTKVCKIESILSDNGPQFRAKIWQERLKEWNVKVKFVSKYHPAGNPSERVMRELGRIFRAYCNEKHTSWANITDQVENWLNCTTNTSTNRTPIELMTNKKPIREIEKLIKFPSSNIQQVNVKNLRIEATDYLTKKAAERKKQFDKRCGRHNFNVGDSVLYRVHKLSNKDKKVIHKFFHLYDGPYIITSAPAINAFHLLNRENGDVHSSVNAADLKPFIE